MSVSGEGTLRPRIAVLVTCHNRRNTTLAALAAVMQSGRPVAEMSIFLVDDGSTDGTGEAVAERYREAHVIRGDGNLFWAAGMCLAERAARQVDPDYFLWLNDDTQVDHNAVPVLLGLAQRYPRSVLVGATCDPLSGQPTYGARRRRGRHPQRLHRIDVSDRIQLADSFNGNLVLVPRNVRAAIGPIDGLFPHAYADDDYGLRATAVGIAVIQAPGTLGSCSLNTAELGGLGITGRWRAIESPKGAPWRAQARFLRRHAGPEWPAILMLGLLRRLQSIGSASRGAPEGTG